MSGVPENRRDPLRRNSPLTQYLCPLGRMVLEAGISLIIEVVEQANDSPWFSIFAEFFSIGHHDRLNCDCMLDQPLLFGIFIEQFPSFITIHVSSLPVKNIILRFSVHTGLIPVLEYDRCDCMIFEMGHTHHYAVDP